MCIELKIVRLINLRGADAILTIHMHALRKILSIWIPTLRSLSSIIEQEDEVNFFRHKLQKQQFFLFKFFLASYIQRDQKNDKDKEKDKDRHGRSSMEPH